MFVGILGAVAAVSSVLDWAADTSDAIRSEEELQTKRALRAMAGASAMAGTKTEDISVPEFVEVPPDPALGNKPVLMTHREAIWWMGVAQDEEMSRHVRKIRKILRAQPARRAQYQCSAR